MNKEELDRQDQAVETTTYQYHDAKIAQQREDGLLSRPEADILDILATQEVTFSVSSSNNGIGQATRSNEQGQRVQISQIYLRCQWNDVPVLRQWITQFLASRQPDATIIAAGMAKSGVTRVARIALHEQQSIEGYLVIGSVEQELHGSVAERVAEHLVAERQISGYAVYTIPVILS